MKIPFFFLTLLFAGLLSAQEPGDISFRILSTLEGEFYYSDKCGQKSCPAAEKTLTGPFILSGTRKLALFAAPILPDKKEKPLVSLDLTSVKSTRLIILLRQSEKKMDAIVLPDDSGRAPAPSLRFLNLSRTPVMIEAQGTRQRVEVGQEMIQRMKISNLTDVAIKVAVPQLEEWAPYHSTLVTMTSLHRPFVLILDAPGEPEQNIPNGASFFLVNDIGLVSD